MRINCVILEVTQAFCALVPRLLNGGNISTHLIVYVACTVIIVWMLYVCLINTLEEKNRV